MKVRDANVWKDSEPYVRDGGVWKPVQAGLVRDAGVWKEFFALQTLVVLEDFEGPDLPGWTLPSNYTGWSLATWYVYNGSKSLYSGDAGHIAIHTRDWSKAFDVTNFSQISLWVYKEGSWTIPTLVVGSRSTEFDGDNWDSYEWYELVVDVSDMTGFQTVIIRHQDRWNLGSIASYDYLTAS